MKTLSGLIILALIPFSISTAAEIVTAEAATQQQVLTGYSRARTVLTLSAEESGKVEQVYADIGEPVPAKGLFICLDDTFLKLEQEGNYTEQARIQVDVDHFRKQVERQKNLIRNNSSAQVQLDESERNLGVAIQQLQNLKIQSRVLGERHQRHCVSAPAGWLVMDRQVETGQLISKGQQVARVGDFSSLLIPFALSFNEYQALQSVQHLQVYFPDMDQSVDAKIKHISPAFDEISRKIMVDLEVKGDLSEPRGGIRAQLELSLPLPSGAVVLPVSALSERFEQYWLTRDDGSEVKVVYLGRDGPDKVKIVSPEVSPGQRFLLPEGK